MTSSEIRKKYIEFFKAHGHMHVASAGLVPDDPTVLFSVAGMVQFKPYFLGTVPKPFTRAVTSQKCLRTNDIENVGFTARHHTFFEMLGNFSFGDYFKTEAIAWAWDFLVNTCGLDKSKLWVTIYKNDDEAYEIWKTQVGVPEKRIVRMGEDTNFWTMGETGPCGPCTEILYDIGPKPGKPELGPDEDSDRYLEIWNLVFTQYDRQADGTLQALPQKNIDTGMGLERLASVMQGVPTNFDTDLFQPLIQAIAQETMVRYGKDVKSDASMKVIADHVRASVFLIFDGILPGNEGRGYVLRRVMRRALRHGKLLGLHEPFLNKLVPQVVAMMGDAYPELAERREHIVAVIKGEEERFQHTLDAGLAILNDMIAELKQAGKNILDGPRSFQLYDTYGFPLDLTREIAAEHKFTVDEHGFTAAMEQQRQRARAAWVGSGDKAASSLVRELAGKLGATAFVGYQQLRTESEVVALLKHDQVVTNAGVGDEVLVVLNQTPFYAESGGQATDIGELSEAGVKVEITEVQKTPEGLYLHAGKVVHGQLRQGEKIVAQVAPVERAATARNHTATHLLQAALRSVLGKHVEQAGSDVRAQGFRFDFTHFQAVSRRELDRIEEIVNAKILENAAVEVLELTLEEAKGRGAMALFGEKYGDWVRMIQVDAFSRELCGGTHAHATGDLGMVRIINESSVSAGVRRIEAVAGEGAFRAAKREQRVMGDICETLHAGPEEAAVRVEKLSARVKELEKQMEKLQLKQATSSLDEIISHAQTVHGVKLVVAEMPGLNAAALRTSADGIKQKLGSGVVVLANTAEGKVTLIATATPDLAGVKIHAGKLAGETAKLVDGSGGGRPDFAQAGGKAPEKLAAALKKVPEILESLITS
ncbi:MAG: alanine--tRNA ligase [Candidatus Firestonebacteria bacterium]|nr:alanine--tRNA ligase [Candidatus Firestonebacteria bacterium]